jgi:tripartite-type tricarboxylate transporter receptor subunit TctC
MKRSPWLAALLVFAVFLPSLAAAQAYPARPVRVIVPSGTGGGLDMVARNYGAKMGENIGQTVVIDNRPGAGGDIGISLVAQAAPDGYTVLLASASSLTRALMYKVPYDMIREFAPVSQTSAMWYVLVLNPGLPPKTVSEFIAYAKANPDRLNYASPGNGSLVHLLTELFDASVGIKMVHVPYKGMGLAFTDLLGGHIQLTFVSIPPAVPFVRAGKLRALGVTTPQRAKQMPELPTMIEAGVTGFAVSQWNGMFAPARTPPNIVRYLSEELAKVTQRSDIATRLAVDGTDAITSTPEEFGAHVRKEFERWKGIVDQAGIRGD